MRPITSPPAGPVQNRAMIPIRTPAPPLARDTSGAVATEYALLIGGIAFTIIALLFNIGDSIAAIFQIIASYLD